MRELSNFHLCSVLERAVAGNALARGWRSQERVGGSVQFDVRMGDSLRGYNLGVSLVFIHIRLFSLGPH